jgi:hypothetical protein
MRTHTHATHIRTHTQNLDFSHATNIKTFLSGEARRDEQNLSEQNLPERREAWAVTIQHNLASDEARRGVRAETGAVTIDFSD